MNSIQALRKEVKKYIDKADENTLKMMYAMLEVQQEENDWWDELPEELQQKIDAGIKEIKAGKTISHAEVLKKHKKWFAK
jgi:predicted transcriptional regulator